MDTSNPCDNSKCNISVGDHACRHCGLYPEERMLWDGMTEQQQIELNEERIHRVPLFDINPKVEVGDNKVSVTFTEGDLS